MKRKGCSIIFVNTNIEVLLFLRDDISGLPYAGMWDVPGGHVDSGESPEDCIVREMKEEINYTLSDYHLYKVYDFSDRVEHVFWKKKTFNIDDIILTEGQCLKWFSREDAQKTKLAYGFNQVVEDFYSDYSINDLN